MGIIYNMDFFKGIKNVGKVDYTFTSPPYNRKRNDKYSFYNDTLNNYYEFLVKTVEELKKGYRKTYISKYSNKLL